MTHRGFLCYMAGLGLFALLIAIMSGCPSQQKAATPTPTAPDIEQPEQQQVATTAGTTKEEEKEMEFELNSSAFDDGATIPEKYTADGADISPALSWTSPPSGTEELVLVCDDPDAPGGPWDHWVVYGMSPDVNQLPEDVPSEERVSEPAVVQGRNDFGDVGYGGPAPPPPTGVHNYRFTLYAVDTKLGLDGGATKAQVLEAIEGHKVAEAQLIGTYSR